MKNCEHFQDRLAAGEELDSRGEEALEFRRHLESCPTCRVEVEGYQRLAKELKELLLPNPGDLFFQNQLRRIEQEIQQEAVSRRTRVTRWWPAFALAAAAVLLFIGLARWSSHEGGTGLELKTALQSLIQNG